MQSQELGLMVAKAVVFLYIVLSPFIDHQKHLKSLDHIAVKVLILILIVIVSFFDFQLAVLLTIALFVMIINFNKDTLSRVFKNQNSLSLPASPYVLQQEQSTAPLMQVPVVTRTTSLEPFNDDAAEGSQGVPQEDVMPYTSDIMFNFPDATCNTKPFQEQGLNTNILSHYIDPKIKPYEVYIKMMTSEQQLASIQDNTI